MHDTKKRPLISVLRNSDVRCRKIGPIFVSSSFLHFKKHHHFFYTWSILCKTLPNFVHHITSKVTVSCVVKSGIDFFAMKELFILHTDKSVSWVYWNFKGIFFRDRFHLGINMAISNINEKKNPNSFW